MNDVNIESEEEVVTKWNESDSDPPLSFYQGTGCGLCGGRGGRSKRKVGPDFLKHDLQTQERIIAEASAHK
jgi:type II secretory ATPase GspE/PulE/Tfp pilus assembly ATPase PilB-like protein